MSLNRYTLQTIADNRSHSATVATQINVREIIIIIYYLQIFIHGNISTLVNILDNYSIIDEK